ncbi:MAG: type II toxin-antitoxin system PemK/MazF family toxin [candidate division KSB1 bacterium]|nr:type II toxin-antitoxin system PemK/MazF family toxin [candidate division KSB1 bacterium]MDZ7303160.1 type II toxin-antitoxin system PemK/MazF family toxin [candidate division KSB1 bacterium]MDZ7310139.1 type II toxin-antitoxin system PemK/MazF family toxin [candidate division KSB1 bacterium]
MPEQGDILLIPIPFTDLSSNKRRPVIVISNNEYNRKTADIVVVGLTSNPKMADYIFTITSSDLDQGKLNRPGQVRVDKIYTLSQSIVVKTFGRVNTSVLDQIRSKLQELTAKKS